MSWQDDPVVNAPAGAWQEDPVVEPPKSVGGFAKNAVKDVAQIGEGVVRSAGHLMDPLNMTEAIVTGSTAPIKRAPMENLEMAKGMVKYPIEEGKRLGVEDLLKGQPGEAAKKFGEGVYQKPVTTALDAAALFGLGKGAAKLMNEPPINAAPASPEIPKPAEPLPDNAPPASRVAPGAPEPIKMPPEAEKILSEEPKPAAPPPPAGFADKLAGKIPEEIAGPAKEVKDYISRGYEGFAKKPGAIANVADYVQEKSQMMAAQQMGITPLQARQIGHEGVRAIGQYGLDSGIVGPNRGLEGMRKLNNDLIAETGQKINTYRTMADKGGRSYGPGELLQAVRDQLDQKYLRGVTEESPSPRGVHGGEAGSYRQALQEIEDASPTHEGAAKVATELNKAANKANRANQPHGAFTDVANTISRINNERVKAIIGPENAAKYEQALKEFGVNKKISLALERKAAGEVKRFGPGSIGSNLLQKAMDEIGYRAGAKIANKVSTSILKNPAIAKSLPSLFKEFINQVDETSHEVTGMAEGGMVTPEMAEYVRAR